MDGTPTRSEDSQSSSVSAGEFRRFLTCLIVILAFTALLYSGTLRFEFVYDDASQIVNNQNLTSIRFVPQYFTQHSWSHDPSAPARFYRPVLLLWLLLNRWMFGLSAWGWHLTTLLMHLAVSALVGLWAWKSIRSSIAASVAALFFAIHPAHVETVAWISDVDDSLMTCFLLVSILLLTCWQENRQMKYLAGALTAFLAALFTKESAIAFPAVVLLAGGYQDRNVSSWRLRPALRIFAWFAALAAMYLAIRITVLGTVQGPSAPIAKTTAWLTIPKVIWFYFRLLIQPRELSAYYAPTYTYSTQGDFWVPLLLVLALVVLVVVLYRATREPVLLISMVWFAAFLLPALNLQHMNANDFIHDRYIYCSSAGWFLFVGWVVHRMMYRLGRSGPILAGICVAIIASHWAWKSFQTSRIWRDDVRLNTRAIQVAPQAALPYNNLAVAVFNQHDAGQALWLIQQAMRLEPGNGLIHSNAGKFLYAAGRYPEAKDELILAISQDPRIPQSYFYLGQTHWRLGEKTQAIAAMRQAIAIDPRAPVYHLALGLFLADQQQYADALAAFEEEVRLFPEAQPAREQAEKLRKLTMQPVHP